MSTCARLNDLLDEALSLPLAQRARWLDELDTRGEPLRARLKILLSRAPVLAGNRFLGTLPKLTESMSPDAAPPAVPVAVGAYRLIREIASGGMGSIWLGERSDGLMQRPVAVKLPRGVAWQAGLGERMARERQILAVLNHPNIARLYDAGVTEEGQPWLALEYVEGRRIDEHCAALELDVRDRLGLFLQMAKAVAHAHAKLIVHRDLKPANVLVTPEGQVRLLDFGIAKLLEGDQLAAGITEFAGRALTIDYASPEQIRGEEIGTATDVYSLGVVLFELLTGVRPHQPCDASRHALEEAILKRDPAKPSERVTDKSLRRQLRGDLDTIVLRALKQQPEERYPTVDAFAEDIERYLAGRPVQARPDSPWYRFGKFVGRNRVSASIAAVLLLVVLAVGFMAIGIAQSVLADQKRLEVIKDMFRTIFLDVDPARPEGIPLETLERTLLEASMKTARTVGAGDYLRLRVEMRLALVQRRLGKNAEAGERVDFVLQTLRDAGAQNTEEYVSALLLDAAFAMEDGRIGDSAAAEDAADRLAANVAGHDRDLTAQARRLLAAAKQSRGIMRGSQ